MLVNFLCAKARTLVTPSAKPLSRAAEHEKVLAHKLTWGIMRYTFALCLLMACSSPPTARQKAVQPSTAALMSATLAVTSVPGSSAAEVERAKERLLTRSDAVATLMAEFKRLPADSVGRWHLVRLITEGAKRGDQSAIKFLLREALVPDPPSKGHHEGVATSDVPEEVMVKLEAASGLILALISNAEGSAQALDDLLWNADAWLAKTVAIQMSHDRVMDSTYSAIMANRGLVSYFRDATEAEVRQRSTAIPMYVPGTDPSPPSQF